MMSYVNKSSCESLEGLSLLTFDNLSPSKLASRFSFCTNSSIIFDWDSFNFCVHIGKSNYSPLSISGNSCCLPDFGGHSIVNELLFILDTSKSCS